MKHKVFETDILNEPGPVGAASSADVLFVAGALRAAQNSSPEVRAKILADIQDYTKTPADHLEFMFVMDNNNDDHSVYDMPDSERRRMIIRNNYLDAAE